MQAGKLDTLFEVLEQTKEKNSAGQLVQSWAVVDLFYGGVEPINTQTFVQSGVQGSAVVCRVVMRPSDYPQINAAQQIRNADTGQLYKIAGILPINKDKQAIMCTIGKLS